MKWLISAAFGLLLAACSQVEPIYDASVYNAGKAGPGGAFLPRGSAPPSVDKHPDCGPFDKILRRDCHDVVRDAVKGQEPHCPDCGPPPPPPPPPPPCGCTEPPSERQKGNNGLGNGDQTAPGGSLDRNKAENNRGIGVGTHRSGKAVRAD